LPGWPVECAFSDASLAGNTLYLAGRIGWIPRPENLRRKLKADQFALDGENDVLPRWSYHGRDLVLLRLRARICPAFFEKVQSIYKSLLHDQTTQRGNFIGADRSCGAAISKLQAIAGSGGIIAGRPGLIIERLLRIGEHRAGLRNDLPRASDERNYCGLLPQGSKPEPRRSPHPK